MSLTSGIVQNLAVLVWMLAVGHLVAVTAVRGWRK